MVYVTDGQIIRIRRQPVSVLVLKGVIFGRYPEKKKKPLICTIKSFSGGPDGTNRKPNFLRI